MFSHPSRKDTIEEIYEWSKTSRGGKQYMLWNTEQLEPTCAKWGLCDFTGSGDTE